MWPGRGIFFCFESSICFPKLLFLFAHYEKRNDNKSLIMITSFLAYYVSASYVKGPRVISQ